MLSWFIMIATFGSGSVPALVSPLHFSMVAFGSGSVPTMVPPLPMPRRMTGTCESRLCLRGGGRKLHPKKKSGKAKSGGGVKRKGAVASSNYTAYVPGAQTAYFLCKCADIDRPCIHRT